MVDILALYSKLKCSLLTLEELDTLCLIDIIQYTKNQIIHISIYYLKYIPNLKGSKAKFTI